MNNNHSHGSAEEHDSRKTTMTPLILSLSKGGESKGAFILRLREPGPNLADSIAFFSMSAFARLQ
jgi:hypothetical protein